MAGMIALIVALGDSGRDHVMDAEFLLRKDSRLERAVPFGMTPPRPSANAFSGR